MKVMLVCNVDVLSILREIASRDQGSSFFAPWLYRRLAKLVKIGKELACRR